jgi:hypothetical protein
MSDVWRSISEAAAGGNTVQVALTPGHKIVTPKRSPGRPRTIGPVRFGHYVGYDETRGGRPRCKLPGCNRYLRRDQSVGCCDDHIKRVQADAERTLALLGREKAA